MSQKTEEPRPPRLYRWVTAPRERPVSRILARALELHLLLFLYYARPVVDDPRAHTRYLFENCDILSDVPVTETASRVTRLGECLSRQLERLMLGTHSLWESTKGEPLGWMTHHAGTAVVEESRANCELLAKVLLRPPLRNTAAAPLRSVLLLSHVGNIRHHEAVDWWYPKDAQSLVEDVTQHVEPDERAVTAGGWTPRWPRKPASGKWVGPFSKTEIARRLVPDRSPRSRIFDVYVEPVFIVRPSTTHPRQWEYAVDQDGEPLRKHSTG